MSHMDDLVVELSRLRDENKRLKKLLKEKNENNRQGNTAQKRKRHKGENNEYRKTNEGR